MAIQCGYTTLNLLTKYETKSSFDASKAAQLKITVKTDLLGSQVTIKYMQDYRAKLSKKFPAALVKALKYLLTKIRDIVPIDTKRLYKSLKIEYSGAGLKTEAFIASDVPYAVYVHEDLNKVHGAKFNRKYAREIAEGIEHERRPQEQAKYAEVPARDRGNQHVMAVLIRENLQ